MQSYASKAFYYLSNVLVNRVSNRVCWSVCFLWLQFVSFFEQSLFYFLIKCVFSFLVSRVFYIFLNSSCLSVESFYYILILYLVLTSLHFLFMQKISVFVSEARYLSCSSVEPLFIFEFEI